MAPKLFDAGKNVWVGPGNLPFCHCSGTVSVTVSGNKVISHLNRIWVFFLRCWRRKNILVKFRNDMIVSMPLPDTAKRPSTVRDRSPFSGKRLRQERRYIHESRVSLASRCNAESSLGPSFQGWRYGRVRYFPKNNCGRHCVWNGKRKYYHGGTCWNVLRREAWEFYEVAMWDNGNYDHVVRTSLVN